MERTYWYGHLYIHNGLNYLIIQEATNGFLLCIVRHVNYYYNNLTSSSNIISSNNFSASAMKLTVTAKFIILDLRAIKKQTDLFTTFKNHAFKWSSLVLLHVYMYCTQFNQMLPTENQMINNQLLNSVPTTALHQSQRRRLECWDLKQLEGHRAPVEKFYTWLLTGLGLQGFKPNSVIIYCTKGLHKI